jgi:hypothetical protein
VKHYAIFLRTGCSLPHGLAPVQEPFCEGWTSVEETAAAALDIKLRGADWHFMWLTEAHSCLGIGRTAESACSNAIAKALKKMPQRFNAAELSLLKITKYSGFQVARVTLQTRQIQQHASLGLVDEMIFRESAKALHPVPECVGSPNSTKSPASLTTV